MQQNNHCRGNSKTLTRQLVQKIWTSRQNNLRPRTAICFKIICWTTKTLGIKSALSTAFHSQTDGTTEWVNQEIEAYLSIYCTSHPEEWLNVIRTLEFTYNNRRHADRQKTPFKPMFGNTPVAVPLSYENTKFPTIEEKMITLIGNWEEALAAHELARTRMIERRKSTFTPFKLGDQVWLDTRNLKTNHHKKIRPRWEGLFKIIKVIGPVTYQLDLPKNLEDPQCVSSHLTATIQRNRGLRSKLPKPPPELIEGEEVYEVKNILKHWRRGQGYQCYIKWKDYHISDASWEPAEVFSDDGDLLTRYKEHHQL